MATIDLGKIKLVWRGTYDGATAYTVDDVVQHTDSGLTSSFICTTASTGNAPSTSGTVHGSWSYLAKGAAAFTSPLTTQGDIFFRDGSGDQRLAAGTSGQVLTTGGSGANPTWGTVSSDFVLLHTTASLSSAATAPIDNVFSSTYQNYKIYLENVGFSTDSEVQFRWRTGGASGADYSTSDYKTNGYRFEKASGSTGANNNPVNWGASQGVLVENSEADNANKKTNVEITLFNPYGNSSGAWLKSWCVYWDSSGTVLKCNLIGAGNDVAIQATGINFMTSAGTFDGGSVKVYGMK